MMVDIMLLGLLFFVGVANVIGTTIIAPTAMPNVTTLEDATENATTSGMFTTTSTPTSTATSTATVTPTPTPIDNTATTVGSTVVENVTSTNWCYNSPKKNCSETCQLNQPTCPPTACMMRAWSTGDGDTEDLCCNFTCTAMKRRVTKQEIIAKIQPLIDDLAHLYNTSFSFGYADGVDASLTVTLTSGLDNRCFGQATDVCQPSDLAVNTRIPAGSVTKAITGLAVMREIERGKINWNTKVHKYVDKALLLQNNVTMAELWQTSEVNKITVKDLLGMRSGLPDYDDNEMEYWSIANPISDKIQPFRYLQAVADSPLICKTPPCPAFYSGVNFVVLGYMMQGLLDYDNWFEYDQMTAIPPQLREEYNEGWVFPRLELCSEVANISHQYASKTLFDYRSMCPTPCGRYLNYTYEHCDDECVNPNGTNVYYDLYDGQCTNGWTMGNVVTTGQQLATFFRDLYAPALSNMQSKRPTLLTSETIAKTMEMTNLSNSWADDMPYGLAYFPTFRKNGNEIVTLHGHAGADWGSMAQGTGYIADGYHFGMALMMTSEGSMNCSGPTNMAVPDDSYRASDSAACAVQAALFELFDNATSVLECPVSIGTLSPELFQCDFEATYPISLLCDSEEFGSCFGIESCGFENVTDERCMKFYNSSVNNGMFNYCVDLCLTSTTNASSPQPSTSSLSSTSSLLSNESTIATPTNDTTTEATNASTTATPMNDTTTEAIEGSTVTLMNDTTTTTPNASTTASPMNDTTTEVLDASTTATPMDGTTTEATNALTTATSMNDSTTDAMDVSTTATPTNDTTTTTPNESTTAPPMNGTTTEATNASPTATTLINDSTTEATNESTRVTIIPTTNSTNDTTTEATDASTPATPTTTTTTATTTTTTTTTTRASTTITPNSATTDSMITSIDTTDASSITPLSSTSSFSIDTTTPLSSTSMSSKDATTTPSSSSATPPPTPSPTPLPSPLPTPSPTSATLFPTTVTLTTTTYDYITDKTHNDAQVHDDLTLTIVGVCVSVVVVLSIIFAVVSFKVKSTNEARTDTTFIDGSFSNPLYGQTDPTDGSNLLEGELAQNDGYDDVRANFIDAEDEYSDEEV